MPSKGSKRNVPEHNMPPNRVKEKKTKVDEINRADDSVTDANRDDSPEENYCDRSTEKVDQLIQCERCEMWLCSICERISARGHQLIRNLVHLQFFVLWGFTSDRASTVCSWF